MSARFERWMKFYPLLITLGEAGQFLDPAKPKNALVTEGALYIERSYTKLKMLDVSEALFISKPRLRFAAPIWIVH
jgi:hypothetical protein